MLTIYTVHIAWKRFKLAMMELCKTAHKMQEGGGVKTCRGGDHDFFHYRHSETRKDNSEKFVAEGRRELIMPISIYKRWLRNKIPVVAVL